MDTNTVQRLIWLGLPIKVLTKNNEDTAMSQSFWKLRTWGRMYAQFFWESLQNLYFWTQHRKKSTFFMILAQFDKIHFTCLYDTLGQFFCAKLSVRKFGCTKKFACRRSAMIIWMIDPTYKGVLVKDCICHWYGLLQTRQPCQALKWNCHVLNLLLLDHIHWSN